MLDGRKKILDRRIHLSLVDNSCDSDVSGLYILLHCTIFTKKYKLFLQSLHHSSVIYKD